MFFSKILVTDIIKVAMQLNTLNRDCWILKLQYSLCMGVVICLRVLIKQIAWAGIYLNCSNWYFTEIATNHNLIVTLFQFECTGTLFYSVSTVCTVFGLDTQEIEISVPDSIFMYQDWVRQVEIINHYYMIEKCMYSG